MKKRLTNDDMRNNEANAYHTKRSDEQFKQQLDSVTYDDVVTLRRIKAVYSEIVEPLSLKQFEPLMFKKYAEMPAIIRRVTKSKRILILAAELEQLVSKLQGRVP